MQDPGLVNFVPAVAYHFCLALPAAFTQPRVRLLAEPCTGRSLLILKYFTRNFGLQLIYSGFE